MGIPRRRLSSEIFHRRWESPKNSKIANARWTELAWHAFGIGSPLYTAYGTAIWIAGRLCPVVPNNPQLLMKRRDFFRKKPSEHPIPEELQRRLDDNAVLRSAFATLTPGRRKSYIFHVSSAKQAKTRAARAEKCVPMILSGRGFNELPN